MPYTIGSRCDTGTNNANEGEGSMSRRYDRPIDCTADEDGCPTHFQWRGRLYRVVEVIDCWTEVGEWWNGEPETVWYRVQTHDKGVFELYSPTQIAEWKLWKVLD